MTSLLITGGAGFIGSNLAKQACESDSVERVAVIDDLSTGDRRNLSDLDVELHEASILDDKALASSLAGIDAVVHLAAIPSVPRSIADPVATHHANATGTLMLLEACRAAQITQIVGASSSAVYGSNPSLPNNEHDWVRPLSPYAVSKLATEQYLLAYQSSFGLSTLAFRFFNVYGPGQPADHPYAAVIPIFLDALIRGLPLTINGDGTNSRDFVFVSTVCDYLLEASINRMNSPEPVNVAVGVRTDLLDLVNRLESLTGKTAELRFGPALAGDVAHSQASNDSLRKLFPNVKPVDLDDGLKRTLEWFLESGAY